MSGGIKREHVEALVEYMSSIEYKNDTKKNLILQVVAFLGHKYPNNIVTVDLDREILSIEGEQREEILNDLKDIGLI